jgi:RimJ/RimL family protein N-acetyltransferase
VFNLPPPSVQPTSPTGHGEVLHLLELPPPQVRATSPTYQNDLPGRGTLWERMGNRRIARGRRRSNRQSFEEPSWETEYYCSLMSLSLSTVSIDSLVAEREAHYARLGYGPELYLELLLRASPAYRLDWNGIPSGYCLMSKDGRLAEFELQQHAWHVKSELFCALTNQLELSGARCFSFNSLLLGLCVEQEWTATVEGTLFRDLSDKLPPDQAVYNEIQLRPATPTDAELIIPHREGVFDSDDECREWISRGHVSVLARSGVFLGMGLLTRVWPNRREHDVGVMIHPDYRHRGYASCVLRTLKERCIAQGMVPTAGCAAENVGSARALHRAGFVSQHSLIVFQRNTPSSLGRSEQS